MINGIIKLFYTEVVKNRIQSLPSEAYEINKEAKKIQNISVKLDKIVFHLLKMLLGVFIFIISSKVNIYLGIFVLILEIGCIFYLDKLKFKLKGDVDNLRQCLKTNSSKILDENIKRNLSILASIIVLGFIMKFNWSIILSIFLVAVITVIKYIRLKNNNN